MYKTLKAKEFKNYDSIVIEEESLETLRKGLDATHSIVKLHAAPINPLDILKLSGGVFSVKTPFTPGSEGSGIIVESQNKSLIGKKVTFITGAGSWSEYQLVSEDNYLILPEDTDLDSAACGYVNPFTAQGLLHQALKYNAKGIVNLAATSALGKMINDLAHVHGINCLNVIRGNQARVESIKAQYQNQNVITLDQEVPAFAKEFKELSEKLSATVCFDPIGGATTGLVFNNLPPNSTLIVYGSLDNKDIEGVNGVQVRWANKRLEGFALFSWFEQLSKAEKEQTKLFVASKANTIFKTQIETSFAFGATKAALTLLGTLKGGKKILLKPTL